MSDLERHKQNLKKWFLYSNLPIERAIAIIRVIDSLNKKMEEHLISFNIEILKVAINDPSFSISHKGEMISIIDEIKNILLK